MLKRIISHSRVSPLRIHQPIRAISIKTINFNATLPEESRTEKPLDPAYFTGNSNYYQFMTNLNEMCFKHGIRHEDAYKLAHSQDEESVKKMNQNRFLWKDMASMCNKLEMKLDQTKYRDILARLNLLFPFREQDPTLTVLLTPFARQSQSLISGQIKNRSLDEQGRAFAMASRKTCRSQAYLVPGEGQVYVNGIHVSDFFDGHLRLANHVIRPFEVSKSLGRYNVWAIVKGGGKKSQADALAVAISRSLCIMDPSLEPALAAEELTKVDLTQKERKKTGQPKARKKNTWVKR